MKTTFFQRFAARSPFLVVDEMLYQIQDRQGEDYVQIGNSRFGIAPSPLLQIEQFNKETHAQEIFSFKQEYIKEALQQEIRSRQDIKNYNDVRKTLDFILFEVLPLMIDTAY